MFSEHDQIEILRDFLGSPSERYGRDSPPRPFVLEFTGSPSAGKTTIIKEVERFLRRRGFRVLCPQEGAEVIRHVERDTPLYNLRTGLYALANLIDLTQNHLYDFVILDRGLFDVFCWMEYWADKNLLDDKAKCDFQNFFLSKFWINRIDMAFFVVCEADAAMEREQKIAISPSHGSYTNPVTITKLYRFYSDAFVTLKVNYPRIHLLDTTNLDKQQMITSVVELILSKLSQEITTKYLGSQDRR